jgi:hypothetical protein
MEKAEKRRALLLAVRQAYMARRRAIHPRWQSSPRWEKFWGKVADTLLREGIDDPRAYVDAQFDMLRPFPQPNMLHGKLGVMNYRDWAGKRERYGLKDEWELQARAELSYLASRRNAFGPEGERREVLDPSTPLSPLFRVCWLLRAGERPPPEWLADARRIARVDAAVRAYLDVNLLDEGSLAAIRGG